MKWDDINLDEEYWAEGDPILFTNQQIRRMLSLARVGNDDVFYDLGCGYGQNLVMALAEFGVRKAVGIEMDRERVWRAKRRMKDLGFEGRGFVIRGDFETVLTERRLGEATVIFYGLEISRELVLRIDRVWKKQCTKGRLIYYHQHLIPEIMPSEVDYPFFVSGSPFRKPETQYEWLSKVVLQPERSVKSVDVKLRELWEEFAHNLDVLGVRDELDDYKERLQRVTKSSSKQRASG